ncbi:TetR/AcrR family transcriptional regulator [Schumannella sp. 10F1B-5-1]|uniref:TetR/AcrR family transcriptional regulator n=1 Tax=Schumannella sp. 10F1B-5-1 TaxID=2590780 RepID=UPI00113063DA|nr:TetR/AcrR family transcriptional regulator [Schumannella sp. 10F1B-5-1]TPW73006.1 TetR/AcrR family transcriptional regulator [Schumannella sp. 10F1B-5-1]
MSTLVDQLATVVQRPKRADAARNFDALVEAARAVFAADGAGASLEEIARRAGVGIGTLYRNFPTRDDLIEAVYVGEVEALVVAAAATEKLPAEKALGAWLRRFVEYIGTKHALIEGLNRESTVFAQCRAVMYGSGEPVLARAQAAGAVRDDVNISDVVRLVSGVAAVAVDDDAQRQRLIGLALDGLRPVG